MNILDYPRKQIEDGLSRAREQNDEGLNDHIRLLFAPVSINDENFERACNIYGRIDPSCYETVVIVEAYDKILDKKLPMASNKFFETPLGLVPVNDYMRNEFCDEDDDFFIDDTGYSGDMSLFQQLMLVQCVFDDRDFSVVSVQIADDRPAIVKELAFVLEEVLVNRNALLVFCCHLENKRKKELERIRSMVDEDNRSALMHYLNSGESHIEGAPAFIAGVIVANLWELKLNFLEGEYEDYQGNLLTAYADRQKVLF